MSDCIKLVFRGAAYTVTGSCTQVSYHHQNILIDCGLFQGPKEIRDLNWKRIMDISKIDAIILTHAHVDHSGLIPKVVHQGFNGPIYCSSGTRTLSEVILPDAAHLQEEDAKYANSSGYSHHKPALPLYTTEDAKKALRQFKTLELERWIEILPGVSCRLIHSGHILGSTFVQLSLDTNLGPKIITFSGDIGSKCGHILRPPKSILETDYLILESTYGDRVHPQNNVENRLEEVVHYIEKSNGVLVIPAFSVGRTQEVLYLIRELEKKNKISQLPVYLDSPMAIEATNAYLKYPEELKLVDTGGPIKSNLSTTKFHAVCSNQESISLNAKSGPMIIISAAGMLTGGRVLHHLKKRLPDHRNAVLFVGYQAEGTKGKLLQNGLSTIRIHHEETPVNARIFTLEGLSAHADSNEMMEWLSKFQRLPTLTFLNHGEKNSLETLAYRIRHQLKIDVQIPHLNEEIKLQ